MKALVNLGARWNELPLLPWQNLREEAIGINDIEHSIKPDKVLSNI